MKRQQAKVYYQTANDFLRRKNYVKAIASYKMALKFAPDYFKAMCNLGVALKQAGMLKEAETMFERALRLKPMSAVICNNLGNVYTAMREFEQAKYYYERAIRLYPAYKAAHYNLGQVQYFSGQRNEAVESRIRLARLNSKKRVVN